MLQRPARPVPSIPDRVRHPRCRLEPGVISAIEPDGIVVATQPGAVRILELQAEGRQPLPAATFVAGRRGVTIGAQFEPLPDAMTTARLAAVRVLAAVERGRTTLAAEIDRARPEIAAGRDRSLFFEIVAGTLRWRNELDALLAQCSRRPIAGLDASVRAIVRIGAYQLRHLDRVPVHAVVHESVELCAQARPRAGCRLRQRCSAHTLARTLEADDCRRGRRPATDRDAALAYLARTLSHPDWLVSRWLDRYTLDDVERWCRFNNSPPDVTVRPIGSLRSDELESALAAADVPATPALFVRDAIRLPPGAFTRLPARLRESVVIQEEASQIVAHAAGARPGERVLDVCAAPGGKTVLLAAAMEGQGLLVAGDVRPGRVRLLSSTLARAQVTAPVIAARRAAAAALRGGVRSRPGRRAVFGSWHAST